MCVLCIIDLIGFTRELGFVSMMNDSCTTLTHEDSRITI